jgi:hypothetical protein
MLIEMTAEQPMNAQEAGCIPKDMINKLMTFMSGWLQESTLRGKMKKAATAAEPQTAPASPADAAAGRSLLPPPQGSQDGSGFQTGMSTRLHPANICPNSGFTSQPLSWSLRGVQG